jgi:hypothetical protein
MPISGISRRISVTTSIGGFSAAAGESALSASVSVSVERMGPDGSEGVEIVFGSETGRERLHRRAFVPALEDDPIDTHGIEKEQDSRQSDRYQPPGLQPGDDRLIEARMVLELLLRPAAIQPEPANPVAERFSDARWIVCEPGARPRHAAHGTIRRSSLGNQLVDVARREVLAGPVMPLMGMMNGPSSRTGPWMDRARTCPAIGAAMPHGYNPRDA